MLYTHDGTNTACAGRAASLAHCAPLQYECSALVAGPHSPSLLQMLAYALSRHTWAPKRAHRGTDFAKVLSPARVACHDTSHAQVAFNQLVSIPISHASYAPGATVAGFCAITCPRAPVDVKSFTARNKFRSTDHLGHIVGRHDEAGGS